MKNKREKLQELVDALQKLDQEHYQFNSDTASRVRNFADAVVCEVFGDGSDEHRTWLEMGLFGEPTSDVLTDEELETLADERFQRVLGDAIVLVQEWRDNA